MLFSQDAIRHADEIIKVVDAFAEARQNLDALAAREIGAICFKGVAQDTARQFWAADSELRRFAYEAANATKGSDVSDISLEIRRRPRGNAQSSLGNMVIFNDDVDLHIDGYFSEDFDDDGNLLFSERSPLVSRERYSGVSHHITREGTTTFLMSLVKRRYVRKLIKNQPVENGEIADTNDIEIPLRGEVVDLSAGDYLALHSYGVYKQPLFAHGTMFASSDRRSIAFNPIEVINIDLTDSFFKDWQDMFKVVPMPGEKLELPVTIKTIH